MPYHVAVVGPGLDADHIEKLRAVAAAQGCTLDYFENSDAALPNLANADILFGPAGPQGAAMAKAAPNLKWFSSFYAGVDTLMAPGTLREDVIITNGSGAYGLTISEHLVMVTLMLLRRYPEYNQFVRDKVFYSDLMIGSIYGATIMICGTGDIGSKFAARLRAFQPARIIGVNRTGRAAEGFDEILPISRIDEAIGQADVVALMLPGTKETDNLFDAQRIARMKPSAFFLNVGRGNAVDQTALVDALNEGRLAGAALDVFRQEPVPAEDPVWTAKNLIFTPHCSGKMTMRYTRDALVDIFCQNLARFTQDQPLLHRVDRSLGY